MSLPHHLPSLTDREAISDVLYRAALGIDTNSQALWDSAWISRSGASITFGAHTLDGDGVQKVFEGIGPMDTSHHVSNIRVHFEDDKQRASATALGLHQHYRAGEGMGEGERGFSLAARRYFCEFVRVEGEWRMTSWAFDTVWNMGTTAIMPF